MPIYEYQCNECDHITEEIESFKSEIRTIICPLCDGISSRILSLGNFQLKGLGWSEHGYEKKPAAVREFLHKNPKKYSKD